MSSEFEHLKLANQLCFPLYAASRLITREYQPYLDELGITYPQYLVLLVLWEDDALVVSEISERLILNTNTLTPLLKRMEVLGLISRKRTEKDERKVVVRLTKKGQHIKKKASSIPFELASGLSKCSLSADRLLKLRENLNALIDFYKNKTVDS
jgi:DNA-binding MarR family transcriptional regulator